MKRWEVYLEIFMDLMLALFFGFAIVYLIPKTLGFLWPFVAAWIIALIANPLRRFLEHKIKISRKYGSALIIIVVLAIIVGGIYLISSRFVIEFRGFLGEIPKVYDQIVYTVDEWNNWLIQKCSQFGLSSDIISKIQEIFLVVQTAITNWIQGLGPSSVKYAGTLAKGVTNGLISTIVMILSAYFFMIEREELITLYHKKFPIHLKEKLKLIKSNISQALGGYVWAQIKIMGIILVILLIGLGITRERYTFLFAILICLMDVLPFLGTGTALIPWGIFCFAQGEFSKGVILLVTYVVCLLSRQIVQPKIIGDSVGLKPLPTLALMYVGIKFAGLIGFIFALVLGIIFLNLYKVGVFDGWINRMKRRFELLKTLD